ncbi:hypothetical protein FM020_12745 [Acinetobacter tandoii]|nr:hypothetical protein FM020_12745 [Acinetobacter tandoii]
MMKACKGKAHPTQVNK